MVHTYFLETVVGVFLEKHVLELKKIVFEKQKGYARKIAIDKSWIIPYCCFCSHMGIHKYTLMSHFKAKTSRYQVKSVFFETFSKRCKSRAPGEEEIKFLAAEATGEGEKSDEGASSGNVV